MTTRDVEEVLSRSVGSFIDPDGAFQKKLEAKARGEYTKDIVIKFGIDPTRPDIHLGHAVILRKLRQFQDLGCQVIFLVGDFTARIGDPTGKSKVRPELEQAEVEANLNTYLEPIKKILKTDDPKLFSWIRNSDWFYSIEDIISGDEEVELVDIQGLKRKFIFKANNFFAKVLAFQKTRMQRGYFPDKQFQGVTLRGLLWTLKHVTYANLIDRDMFQDRINGGEQLYMHEMLYPVLQGIDSLLLNKIYGSCDLEIGGTDQTFNMLMGRTVMKSENIPQQAVMSLEIIPGLDGKEKMSKSLDNYIAITDSASDMYGKVMSIPDNVISTYFKLATYTPLADVEEIEKELSAGKSNPKDVKMRLAREIVAEYHGKDAASVAEADFVETFSKGGIPTDIPVIKTAEGTKIVDILLSEPDLIESKSEWRRLVEEGAVSNAETGEKIASADVVFTTPITLKIGKRRFIKIDTL